MKLDADKYVCECLNLSNLQIIFNKYGRNRFRVSCRIIFLFFLLLDEFRVFLGPSLHFSGFGNAFLRLQAIAQNL